ncbi:MAG: putative endonuclease [Tepidanaerobacteraceae bacterium]|nr:putative endonuclease [Tepidanaerobacteraceae bacterium]
MERKKIGDMGEKYALDYLKANNYEIVKVNYRSRYGEIDIIAREKNTLVFIEVKTRTSDTYGRGLEAVDIKKRKKIRLVSLNFLSEYCKPVGDFRFDVIEVNVAKGNVKELVHVKNAF